MSHPASAPSVRNRRRRRQVATAAVTLAIMGISVLAGIWQYGRHVERADAQERFLAASVLPATGLAELAQPGSPQLDPEAVWRTVTVTGSFAPMPSTPLRNRPIERTASLQYLAWFEPVEGGALLVNTGWRAVASAGDTLAPPDLPRGQVSIEVILRELEPDDGRRDDGATRINLAHVPAPPAAAYPAYGMMRDSCEPNGPCFRDQGLADVPLPALTTGPHLSYAWQWWAFATLAPVGAGVLWRRDDAHDAPASGAQKAASRATRQRGLSDEEVEDAL